MLHANFATVHKLDARGAGFCIIHSTFLSSLPPSLLRCAKKHTSWSLGTQWRLPSGHGPFRHLWASGKKSALYLGKVPEGLENHPEKTILLRMRTPSAT